jgi:hypothetical protein
MEWVVTDDIYQEVWRRLLEFANIDLTVDEIARRHGKPVSPAERGNYRKQAAQARVCVLQAKEYFDAAASSTLFTAPNHLYYGMVSISSLMMLVMGNGTRSLDFLRHDARNAHHGLRFTTGCSASKAKEALSLLEHSSSTVLEHGHFLNWYTTLPARSISTTVFTSQFEGGRSVRIESFGGFDMMDRSQIVGWKTTALELMRNLPDLHKDLRRYGVQVASMRASHEVFESKIGVRHVWTFHDQPSSKHLEEVLSSFAAPPRLIDRFVPRLRESGVVWCVEFNYERGEPIEFSWPNSRSTMSHDSIFYAGDIRTNEIVDAHLVAYQLSMLSRYYPDLWVACLESHCKAAKLIEQTIGILLKKAPILALSLLSRSGLTISTHREPWN